MIDWVEYIVPSQGWKLALTHGELKMVWASWSRNTACPGAPGMCRQRLAPYIHVLAYKANLHIRHNRPEISNLISIHFCTFLYSHIGRPPSFFLQMFCMLPFLLFVSWWPSCFSVKNEGWKYFFINYNISEKTTHGDDVLMISIAHHIWQQRCPTQNFPSHFHILRYSCSANYGNDTGNCLAPWRSDARHSAISTNKYLTSVNSPASECRKPGFIINSCHHTCARMTYWSLMEKKNIISCHEFIGIHSTNSATSSMSMTRWKSNFGEVLA